MAEAEGELSGSFVLRHREIFKEKFGSAALGRALDRLAAEEREGILGADPLGWVPVRMIEAFYAAMAAELGRDAADLHEECAQIAAERTIRTFWRILMRFTSDGLLIARTPVFYAKTWSRGTLEARSHGPGRAGVTLGGWPEVPDFTIRGVRIALAKAMELAGRRGVRVTSERTPSGAEYRIRWTP